VIQHTHIFHKMVVCHTECLAHSLTLSATLIHDYTSHAWSPSDGAAARAAEPKGGRGAQDASDRAGKRLSKRGNDDDDEGEGERR
jgi:hypothetical protein